MRVKAKIAPPPALRASRFADSEERAWEIASKAGEEGKAAAGGVSRVLLLCLFFFLLMDEGSERH